MSLIRLDHVVKRFERAGRPTVHAVNDVSLEIGEGETLALIGESGCGKSTIGRLALGLYHCDEGELTFDGEHLERLSKKELRRRRSKMTMVFQEPFESLNPRQSVGRTIAEPLAIHEPGMSSAERRQRVLDTLDHVALPRDFVGRYPGELSGGQQQRVGVARAIVTRPRFIVLDEPTSSLDLSVRAQILKLLARLQEELDLAYLFISHDIHTIEYVSDRIAVMYLGRVVETGSTTEVFGHPRHPYTQALLSATLSADPDEVRPQLRLQGEVGSPTQLPTGCPLYGRCPIGTPECAQQPVPLRPLPGETEHAVACIKVATEEPATTPA